MAIKTKGFVKGCLPEELKRVLRSVAADWGDAMDDMEALQVIQLSGAMTNEVYQINWPTRNGEVVRKVLVRVYGEGVQLFFNRDEEIRTFECISENGQGPRLLGQFSDGRVEEFIHARVSKFVILMFILYVNGVFVFFFTKLLLLEAWMRIAKNEKKCKSIRIEGML